LRGPGQRRITLDGQRFDPQDPDARLYAAFFCRNCGQEHHSVVLGVDGGVTRVLPRPIDETPIDETEDGEQAGGPRSRLARQLGQPGIWGKRLNATTYVQVVEALLTAAASYEMVRAVGTSFDVEGWRIAANAIRLVEAEGRSDGRAANSYFVSLYRSLADALASGAGFLFGLDGREHTAQVDQVRRQWREWRFRWGTEDR
jgi:hypothetical protein